MKIAINLLPFREKIAGAGKYAKEIVYGLSELDSENEYFLFISQNGKKNFNINKTNFHFIMPNFNPDRIISRIFWEQLVFPFKLRKLKPDIVFTPSVAIPLVSTQTFFTSIHDIAYKKNKLKYPFLRRIYIRLVTSIAAKKSKVIFALTEAAKNEIRAEFNLSENRFQVTYVGVEDGFFKQFANEEKSKFAEKFNLPEEFILYVGAIEPGKNLDKLFIAFSEVVKTRPGIKFVLTSGIGWEQQGLESIVNSLNIRSKIIFLPYIEEIELPLLYKCASMLVYLSSYEGFGMPVLEAMAAGTPVLTSKSKAILEFAEECVFSVDPNAIDAVVNAIELIFSDLDSKQAKINRGKEIALKFTWSNSSKLIYEEFLKSRSV